MMRVYGFHCTPGTAVGLLDLEPLDLEFLAAASPLKPPTGFEQSGLFVHLSCKQLFSQ